jgi:hypothetical protein
MSEKSGPTVGKRQRKYTDADEDSLQALRQALTKAEEDAEIWKKEKQDLLARNKRLAEDKKIDRQDIENLNIDNARHSEYVRELISIQKVLTEQLQDVQETLQKILLNQNKNDNTLESIKDSTSKQAEEIKT